MQIKNRQQFLIIAAAVGVGLLLVDNMIVDPLVSSWKERREKISKLEDKLAINKRLLAHEGAVIARWDDMRTNMLQGDASAADSQMIQSFDRWSQASGISIKDLTNYFNATMALSGPDFDCWNIIQDYLVKLPDSEFQKLHVGDHIQAKVVVSDPDYYVTSVQVVR